MIFPWQKWKKLAYTDDLTGVWNRRYLFSREWEKKKFRYLYFIDINNLGEINRREGFLAGDRVIKETAKELQYHAEKSIVCRVGGDEFVILSNDSFLVDYLSRLVNATIVRKEINVREGIGSLIQSASLECSDKKEPKEIEL
jgi:diguanylate cyclase (GGDEF)-like protein